MEELSSPESIEARVWGDLRSGGESNGGALYSDGQVVCSNRAYGACGIRGRDESRSCVVFVGGKAVPADRDFPACAETAGKGGSESERAGTANPVHKGHDGSDERDPKPPKREKKGRDSGRVGSKKAAGTKEKTREEVFRSGDATWREKGEPMWLPRRADRVYATPLPWLPLRPARKLALPELAPSNRAYGACGIRGRDESRSCVVFVGGKAVPADRDFLACAETAGKGGSESERAGTANPVHKGHDGSDERDPKPPKGAKLREPKARARAREAGPRAPTQLSDENKAKQRRL
ncbi:hypothetical protein B0H11DRAFT_2420405 [Mycena galericulata]|nr:hypothetical protein B0H11DRAFT_2420405 [Mycena galericulata]